MWQVCGELNNDMRFKDLSVGTVFEFDHSELPCIWSGAIGPWRKVSAGSYVEDEAEDEPCNRIRVGSPSVAVIVKSQK